MVKKRADIKAGKSVTFTATIEVPPNTGKIVSAEWDFEGTGTFDTKEKQAFLRRKMVLLPSKIPIHSKKQGLFSRH